MAALDQNIYLSRLDEFQVDGAQTLEEELVRRMATARRITILSAYYGAGYLSQLFKKIPRAQRRNCDLTLVFGTESGSRLIEAFSELRTWQRTIEQLGFASLDIRLVTGGKPFHVKLFHLLNGNRPSWFVGSANASGAIGGDRHELMVRVFDRHPQLQAYMAAVRDGSVPLDDIEVEEAEAAEVTDLRSFLLAGHLCYSPIHRLTFTFEACTLRDEHKQALDRRIRDVSEVPFSAPKTEGFGLSFLDALRDILGPDHVPQTEAGPEAAAERRNLRWRPYGIETSLGYWIPEAFIGVVERQRSHVEGRIRERFERLGKELSGEGQESLDAHLEQRLQQHVEGLQAFFASHGPPIEPRRNHVERFRDWVDTRRTWLTDPEMLNYLASRLVIERVPNLWAAESATASSAAHFEESFLKDLAFRLEVPGQNRVAKVMKRELDGIFSTPTQLRKALARRLGHGFGSHNWTGEEPEEDENEDE